MSAFATCGKCKKPYRATQQFCPDCLKELHADVRLEYGSKLTSEKAIEMSYAQAVFWCNEVDRIMAANDLLPLSADVKNIIISRAITLQLMAMAAVALAANAGVDTFGIQATNQNEIDAWLEVLARKAGQVPQLFKVAK